MSNRLGLSIFVVMTAFLCTALCAERLVVVGKLVNIRSGPGRSYSVVGQVRNGQLVNYEGTEGLWTKIGEFAYIPTIYALPKNRVSFSSGAAVAKSLDTLRDALVTPVVQTTKTAVPNASGNGTTTVTKTTALEVPVAVAENTSQGLGRAAGALPVVNATSAVSVASRTQPNQVSTTTALSQLAERAKNATAAAAAAETATGGTSTSTSTTTASGSTLMGLLQSKPADLSALKTYTTKHVRSKMAVDSLLNVPAYYDAEPKEDTEYTCDEYVRRFYQSTRKTDVVLDASGKPTNGFVLTLSPKAGDIAASAQHRAVVKQVAGEVATLIEQNYKWADKRKTGYYAPKNRRLTLRQGIGVDSLGVKYTFYTKPE